MWRKYTSVLTCCSLWIFQYFLLACANYIYWRSGSARTFCSTFLGDDLDEFSHAPCLCLCHWQDFHVIHVVQSNCYWLPCKSDVISPDVGDVDLVPASHVGGGAGVRQEEWGDREYFDGEKWQIVPVQDEARDAAGTRIDSNCQSSDPA